MSLRKWWRAHKERRDMAIYDRGYNWAAGELLSGISLEEVESEVLDRVIYGYCGQFDVGVREAIFDWEKLTGDKA